MTGRKHKTTATTIPNSDEPALPPQDSPDIPTARVEAEQLRNRGTILGSAPRVFGKTDSPAWQIALEWYGRLPDDERRRYMPGVSCTECLATMEVKRKQVSFLRLCEPNPNSPRGACLGCEALKTPCTNPLDARDPAPNGHERDLSDFLPTHRGTRRVLLDQWYDRHPAAKAVRDKQEEERKQRRREARVRKKAAGKTPQTTGENQNGGGAAAGGSGASTSSSRGPTTRAAARAAAGTSSRVTTDGAAAEAGSSAAAPKEPGARSSGSGRGVAKSRARKASVSENTAIMGGSRGKAAALTALAEVVGVVNTAAATVGPEDAAADAPNGDAMTLDGPAGGEHVAASPMPVPYTVRLAETAAQLGAQLAAAIEVAERAWEQL